MQMVVQVGCMNTAGAVAHAVSLRWGTGTSRESHCIAPNPVLLAAVTHHQQLNNQIAC